jgi:hypothetical protein
MTLAVAELTNREASSTSIAPLLSVLRAVPPIRAISTAKCAIGNVMRELLATVSTLGGITTVLVGMISFSLPLNSTLIAYPETISFASFVVVLLWEVGERLHLSTPTTFAHDRFSKQTNYSSPTILTAIPVLLNFGGRNLKLFPTPLTLLRRFIFYAVRAK